jgi:hypothetical protein
MQKCHFFGPKTKIRGKMPEGKKRTAWGEPALDQPPPNALKAATGWETVKPTTGGHEQSLCLLLFEQAQNLLDHFPVFQADGQKNGFHGPGTSHVHSGTGMKFSPVKKTVKCLLVFFAQSTPKWFPPFPFGFQNMTERHNCPAHFPSQTFTR